MFKKKIRNRILKQQFEKFTSETGIVISDYSKSLINFILNSIIMDPHPSWKIKGREKVKIRTEMRANVSSYLKMVSEIERVEKKVTVFEILHGLSKTIDQMCPIDKNSEAS